MSIKVMNWVWDYSPARGTELLMMLAIADAASDDGTNAFPSVRTLARKTRLDGRTVQRIARRLAEGGHLAIEERGGRESNRYSVLMRAELSTPPADRRPRQTAAGDTASPPDPRHGSAIPAPAQPRHLNPPGPVREPSSSPTVDDDVGSSTGSEGAGRTVADVDAVLEQLGPAWPLSPKQRRRLAPKVVEALAAGWSAERLAERLAANPDGVRSPAAVLASRLDELRQPRSTAQAATEAATWCGGCESPGHRLRERPDGRWERCPTCHPQASREPVKGATQQANSGPSTPPSTHGPEFGDPTDQQTGRSHP